MAEGDPVVLTLGLTAIAGYLLGSVAFGLVLTRAVGIDLRGIGSGNIGATNVLRTGRKGLALATLLLDSGKGAIAALLAWWLIGHEAALAAGFGAVLGHNFPIWLNFKGGKGVATTLGVLVATAWPVGLAACATWLLVAAVSRYSSLSALIALAAAPVYSWYLAGTNHAAMAAALALLAFLRHQDNIRRLVKGTESRIGEKKK